MFTTKINDIPLTFTTYPSLFSPNAPDNGTLAMLSAATCGSDEKILDLGCGYGLAGIYLAKKCNTAKIVMSDIDPIAVAYAIQNAIANCIPVLDTENPAAASGVKIICSDGFTNITDSGFTLIVCNPPYHTDFSVAKRFIEKGFNRMAIGGRMFMVTKRKEWYKRKFIAIFGGVRITELNGYFVFMAEKQNMNFAKRKK